MRYLLLAIFVLSSAGTGHAEFIRMKDGREFEGEILEEAPDSLKIRERYGESIIEIDYPKADIEHIGPPAEAEQKEEPQAAKTSPEQEAEIAEDPGYEEGIDKIISMVRGLERSWEVDPSNAAPAKEWLKDGSPAIKEFKEKYGRSKRISYAYIQLAFSKLSNFFNSVREMEEKQNFYKENVKADTPDSIKASLKDAVSEYGRIASDSLKQAVQYLSMAKDKALKQ